jgi:chemotaxis protein methyltransferase WspC
MALLDAGLPRDQIRIDAVDISAQAIARAKRGSYGPNSFRGDDLTFRERYFERTGNRYLIPQTLRELVTFHHENILSPEFRAGISPYDVIFCRNVLIYFDAVRQQIAIEKLNSLLDREGCLFVGPAEAFLAARSGFIALSRKISFVFRKDCGIRTRLLDLGSSETKEFSKLSTSKLIRMPIKPIQLPVKIIRRQSFVQDPVHADTTNLANAKRLADVGRLEEAARICESCLKAQGPMPEAYYLLGLLRDAAGDAKGATDCYRKVLYLEPDHLEALIHLALLCERQGDHAAGRRLRHRAQRSEGLQIHGNRGN